MDFAVIAFMAYAAILAVVVASVALSHKHHIAAHERKIMAGANCSRNHRLRLENAVYTKVICEDCGAIYNGEEWKEISAFVDSEGGK